MIIITWYKTFRQTKEAYRMGFAAGLGTMLLRYGALSCIVIVTTAIPDI